MSINLYKNYTSTSVLSNVDPEKFTKRSHAYFKKVIAPHLPNKKDCAILEIGCGYGRYTSLIVHQMQYTNVVGVDISEEQIEYARNHYNLQNVFVEDALAYMQRTNQKYDVVILMDVLEHLELNYAVSLLNAVHSALSQEGKLIIQVPNGISPMNPLYRGDVTHIRPYSVNSISQILRMAGFSKFSSYAIPPAAITIKSFILRYFWIIVVRPCIYLFMILVHGNSGGGIYSSNLLTVANK